MKENDWSYDQAFTYVKQKRSCINPNDGFRQQLATYESILNAHKAKYNLFEPVATASTTSLNSNQEQTSNGSTSPPTSRNSFETNNPSFLLTPANSNEPDLIPKMFVKETINKLKSISSSEQLPVNKVVVNNISPPMSPSSQQKKISSVSFVLSASPNIKRTQSQLTSNEIRKKNIDDSTDSNENFYRSSPSSHMRSKSTSDNNNKEFFSKLRQSWTSTDTKTKLNELNIYSSENNLNSTSSSSSSSLRSAVRHSLTMNEDHLSSLTSSGNVKRQVESINFKSRPCTPQQLQIESEDQLNNMNKRQSVLSLGETIAEVDDDLLISNQEKSLNHLVPASLSPDGKRFKLEQNKQLFESSLRDNTIKN